MPLASRFISLECVCVQYYYLTGIWLSLEAMHMAQSMGMLTEDSIESMSNQKDNIISHGERHTAASIIWSFECNSLNLQIWSFSFPLVNAHVLSPSVSCKNMRYKQHRTRGCAISGAKICSSKCSYPKKSWAPSLVTNSESVLGMPAMYQVQDRPSDSKTKGWSLPWRRLQSNRKAGSDIYSRMPHTWWFKQQLFSHTSDS